MENPKIIFEDNDVLVVSKPSGWITNDADTAKEQPVLQRWLKDMYDYETTSDRQYRDGIVHRLDKETSGILLVGKTFHAFENLQRQFKERVVTKRYQALVHGKVKNSEGSIAVPVGRLPWRRDRFGVLPGGRNAFTKYTVISAYRSKSREDFTLVELSPKTGRTHQIRIHMKHLGHPLVSDTFYAGRKTARKDRVWCARLFLHASSITFNHPRTEQSMSFDDSLPQDLSIVLSILEPVTA